MCLQKLLGWAQEVSWAYKPPCPCNRVFNRPFLSRQGPASTGPKAAMGPGGGHPSLLDVPHGDPSVDGSRVPRPACPRQPVPSWSALYPQDPGHLKGGGAQV